jgi:hypothetical protein
LQLNLSKKFLFESNAYEQVSNLAAGNEIPCGLLPFNNLYARSAGQISLWAQGYELHRIARSN